MWLCPIPARGLEHLILATLSHSLQRPTQQQKDPRSSQWRRGSWPCECRDGESNNLTWNCGAEGPTSDLRVQRLRARQQRNLAAALLLSQGVPMILMGDEYGHSKVSCLPAAHCPHPAGRLEPSCRRYLGGCRAGTTTPTATTRRSIGSTGGKRQPMRLDLPASSGCWSTCGVLPAPPFSMAQRSAAKVPCHAC